MTEQLSERYRNHQTPPNTLPVPRMMTASNGDQLEVFVAGNGEKQIVFCHPHTGSAASFAYQFEAFATLGYQVIAYSRPGHGRSQESKPDQRVTRPCLDTVLDTLNISSPVHLVGIAAGGMEASAFALHAPERVASLTIACSLIAPKDRDWSALFEQALGSWMKELPPDVRELSAGFRAVCPAETEQWALMAKATEAIPPKDLASNVTLDGLSALGVPKLLIAGAADLYLAPVLAEEAARRISAEYTLIDDVGHAPHYEMPHEFNARIDAFIRSHHHI